MMSLGFPRLQVTGETGMDCSSAERIAAAIERWLLESETQILAGPESGGVAGTLDADGRPLFLYPEAAGYYLRWLVFLAESAGTSAMVEDRARLTATWICRWLDHGGLRTRSYLVPNGHDWRIHATFAFDVGMVWRGMAAAGDLLPGHDSVLARLSGELRRFISGSGFMACRQVAGSSQELPQRWSTQPGPYQMKISAPLLRANVSYIPEDLRRTAASSYRFWRERLEVDTPVDEPHPLFYALEGLLHAANSACDPGALDLAARIYSSLLEESNIPTWLDPASKSTRSDVLAQALRMGSALLASGRLEDTDIREHLSRIACRLSAYVSPAGAVSFMAGAERPVYNTWAAMFAHQAFCYYAASLRGEPLERRWIELLV